MKKTNETSTTRQLALKWWNKLSLEAKFYKTIANNEFITGDKTRHPDTLTGREIEIIWRKENNLEFDKLVLSFKSNKKQFVEFDSELFIKYINKFSEEDKRKAFSLLCDLLEMGKISQKELDDLQEMSWNHPG